MKKRISVILAFILVLSAGMYGMTASAENEGGSCGEGALWEYDEIAKTLTISGTGDIAEYSTVKINDSYVTGSPWGIYYDSMEKVVIENGITRVAESAFYGCKALREATVPGSVTTIEDLAFYNCTGLENLTLSEGIKNITGDRGLFGGAFYSCKGLATLTLPESLEYIGDSAFNSCTKLTDVTIPGKVREIDDFAFANCDSLKQVTIGNGAESVGKRAFHGCHNLTQVTIGANVKAIGEQAFNYCGSLVMSVPSGVTSIGNNAFYDVLNIVYSGTASGSPWGAKCINGYVDGYFVFTDSSKKELSGCSEKATVSVAVPSGTQVIGDYAFRGCSELSNVYIPESVTEIGEGGFMNSGVDNVYYEGSAIKKLSISIGDNNSVVTGSDWHYNSKVSDMPAPGSEPSEPSVPAMPADPEEVAKATINAATGTKQIDWKYKARLVATGTDIPSGCHIGWYENNGKVSDSADFTTGSLTSSHTYTAKIIDATGNAVSSAQQEKTVTIEVKSDFFTKIISFFMRLFGSDVVKI